MFQNIFIKSALQRFSSQEHNTPTEQLFQGEKNNFSHFTLVDISILLQWQLLISK